MSLKTTLKKQLSQGKTRAVIAELQLLTRSDSDLHDEAVALSARYQQYLREKHGNTTSRENLEIELNRIHAAALDLIGRLPERRGALLIGWRKIAALIGSILIFGAAVAEFSGYSLRDVFTNQQAPTAEPKDTLKNATEQPPANPGDTTAITPTQPGTVIKKQTDPNQGNLTRKKAEQATGALSDTTLRIAVKTDKGTENLRYRTGETMRLYFKTNQPCHIRIIYRLADGSLVLFDDDRQLNAAETGRFVEIGSGYEASPPFGEEALYVFAQSGPFPALKTTIQNGYTLVSEGLPETLRKTRGFKKKYRFAEASLKLTTFE